MGKSWLTQCVVWIAVAFGCTDVRAYEAPIHQQITFIAARHLNACLQGSSIPPIAPLEVRYVARANVRQEESGWLRGTYRSDFYDRAQQAERNFFFFVDTRVHEQFREIGQELDAAVEPADRYSALGRVVNILQDMTSPAHVVPVYFTRWWRFNVSDRFNEFRIDDERIEAEVAGQCDYLYDLVDAPDITVDALLVEAANDTLDAVQRPIEGLPVTWQAFWRLADDPEDFGEYGVAGNQFGRRAQFDCGGQRCVLLDRDPLYVAFAHDRHLEAVRVTARALLAEQRRYAPPMAVEVEVEVDVELEAEESIRPEIATQP